MFLAYSVVNVPASTHRAAWRAWHGEVKGLVWVGITAVVFLRGLLRT